MQPVNLFKLAAEQAHWLGVRQSVIAGNIANANTPGYGALDVKPFSAVLDNRHVALAATDPKHLTSSSASIDDISLRQQDEKSEIIPSHNTVSLETELMKSADVRNAFELNTAIVKAFHSMFTMTTGVK